jgi:hypothetical protein
MWRDEQPNTNKQTNRKKLQDQEQKNLSLTSSGVTPSASSSGFIF